MAEIGNEPIGMLYGQIGEHADTFYVVPGRRGTSGAV